MWKLTNHQILFVVLFIFKYNSQLEQAEIAFKTDDQEIEEVRKEFTVRVSTTEKKFQAAAKVCLYFCAKRSFILTPFHIQNFTKINLQILVVYIYIYIKCKLDVRKTVLNTWK